MTKQDKDYYFSDSSEGKEDPIFGFKKKRERSIEYKLVDVIFPDT